MTLNSPETRDSIKKYFQNIFYDKNLFPNFPETTKISVSYSYSKFNIIFKAIAIQKEKPSIEDYFLHIFGSNKSTLTTLFYSFSIGLMDVLNVNNIQVGFKNPEITKARSSVTFKGLTAIIKVKDLIDICYLLKELKLHLSIDKFPTYICYRMERDWYFGLGESETNYLSWDGKETLYRQEVEGDGSCLYTSLYYYEKHPELPIILYNYNYDGRPDKPHYEILLLNKKDVEEDEISFSDIKEFRIKVLNFMKHSNFKVIYRIEEEKEEQEPVNLFESNFKKNEWLNEQYDEEYGDDNIIMAYIHFSNRDIEVYSGAYNSYALFSLQ